MAGNDFEEHAYIESDLEEDSEEKIGHVDYLEEPIYVTDLSENSELDIHIYI